MKEGEALDVTVQAESGNISLIIRRRDDEPIYRGNNLESTAFQIGIEQEGTYTLTVEGERARNNYIPFVETTHFLTKTPQFLIV